jgi:hypothetical protein
VDVLAFCRKCGSTVETTQIFCVKCGHRLDETKEPSNQAAVGEVVLGVVPHLAKVVEEGVVGFLRERRYLENLRYNLVATNQRIILAQISVKMMQEIRAQKKAQAKGIMGKLLAGRVVLGNEIDEYSQKYLSMPPEQIISETPGNVALYPAEISRVNVELKVDDSEDDFRDPDRWVLTIESKQNDYKFYFLANPQDLEVLRRVLGDKVHGSGQDKPYKPLF